MHERAGGLLAVAASRTTATGGLLFELAREQDLRGGRRCLFGGGRHCILHKNQINTLYQKCLVSIL